MRLPLYLISSAVFIFALFTSTNHAVIKVNEDIELVKIEDGFYVHTTWFELPDFGRFPSNGLVFIKNGKALLIDTPNSNAQTEILYHYLKDSLNTTVEKVIVGHSHSDCIGGLAYLHRMGIESIAGDKTQQICISQNLPVPKTTFSDSLTFNFEGEKIMCRYFGAGHTIDNIVVYFPHSKILFGGCLIRSLNAKGLGYTKEAVIDAWDETVMRIRNAFPEMKYVIPGHGQYGDRRLLDHTMKLVEDHKRE